MLISLSKQRPECHIQLAIIAPKMPVEFLPGTCQRGGGGGGGGGVHVAPHTDRNGCVFHYMHLQTRNCARTFEVE